MRGRNVSFHVLATELGDSEAEPRVAFAVSRKVGGSVTRHRVTRRLRHIIFDNIEMVPNGTRILVRAYPRAADVSFAELASDVSRLISRVANA